MTKQRLSEEQVKVCAAKLEELVRTDYDVCAVICGWTKDEKMVNKALDRIQEEYSKMTGISRDEFRVCFEVDERGNTTLAIKLKDNEN